MPPSTTRPTETRWAREANSGHRFAVGQRVRLKGGLGRPSDTAVIYRITARLPLQDRSPQYRVRGDGEFHERVAQQESLELIAPADLPDENAALIERTFVMANERKRGNREVRKPGQAQPAPAAAVAASVSTGVPATTGKGGKRPA